MSNSTENNVPNHDIREDLFGRVHVVRTGTFVPDPVLLHSPFEGTDSVLYRFCRGCGFLAEVNETIARRLVNEAGASFADKLPTEVYFETEECILCTNGETIGLTIKEIPNA